MSKGKPNQSRNKSKNNKGFGTQENVATIQEVPLIQLPLYAQLNPSDYWYGLIPELICIQRIWIQEHIKKIQLPVELAPYINNAINQHHTALIIAGNNQAYFALYSLRSILERVAMGWSAHSSATIKPQDIVNRLASENADERKRATQDFIDFAHSNDSILSMLYDMVSQYFAHASKMDGMVLEHKSEKDMLLLTRIRVLPLLLLLDVGSRFVTLIQALLDDQEIVYDLPVGGRVPKFSFNIDWYVRLCTYVMCEKHSAKRGINISTLYKNTKEIQGEIRITTIYRGGMEVVRFGDSSETPDPSKIASFAWYAIGRNHDNKVKVKCVSKSSDGERYLLNWPKHLELEGAGLAMIAAHGNSNLDFFDYITTFLKVIEAHK